MKKFLTLLSAALISVVSFATVASADEYKPTVALDVTRVLPNGNAIVSATVKVEKDFDFTNMGDDSFWWVSGSGMSDWQIDIDVNDDIFSVDTTKIVGSFALDFSKVKTSANGLVNIGTAVLGLEADYKSKTAEEINALKFAEVTSAVFVVTEWNESMDPNDGSAIVSVTNYRSDGANGAIVVDLSATRIGTYVDEPVTPPTPPAPAADVTVSAKTDAEAAWEAETGKNAVYWGVDFADGKFPGSAKATFTAGEDKRELNITYDESFNIGGEVSFAVYVIADETITDVVTMALEAAGCTVQYN